LFAIIGGFVVATLAGCAAETRKSQALSQLDRLEGELQKGVSTKADVLFLLGEPSGSGGAEFPTAQHANDVWYYEASNASMSGVNMNILLIYFKDDAYDGFMWFSNEADIDFE
jgi:outer membrane protein assembly factor BamE (lipoprotein component of BamABCDE complex)